LSKAAVKVHFNLFGLVASVIDGVDLAIKQVDSVKAISIRSRHYFVEFVNEGYFGHTCCSSFRPSEPTAGIDIETNP